MTSSRSESVLLVGERGQLIPRPPQLRIEALLDQPAEELDGCALRADHLVADHTGDYEVVPHPPQRDVLVPADQQLGEFEFQALMSGPLSAKEVMGLADQP